MSTIYTDAAGNKYLGDCRWGNHDILYPSANFLLSVATTTDRVNYGEWRDDFFALLTDANFTITTQNDSNTDFPPEGTIYQANYPSTSIYTRLSSVGSGWSGYLNVNNNGAFNDNIANNQYNPWSYATVARSIDFCSICSSHSTGNVFWYGETRENYRHSMFYFTARLLDVNTNFSYYTGNNNNLVTIGIEHPNVPGNISTTSTSLPSVLRKSHFIAGAKKTLLETGRAAYTISCSDGQTPGAQWATDMWVYDNNATLGYPVIGRVPNMLLGVGTYTYLKPVKIEGSVFPDNGSPWYLPVGTYAGKTLLMRCYSSVT